MKQFFLSHFCLWYPIYNLRIYLSFGEKKILAKRNKKKIKRVSIPSLVYSAQLELKNIL